MRLLSTKALEFCDFLGTDIPQYAILSHRWERDEISYQDMAKEMERNNNTWPGSTDVLQKQGYRKISEFRRLALKDGYEYIWVDTCCIDKTSSAELQEAINSMYQWYWNSDVCYAYLSDASVPTDRTDADGRLLFKPSDLQPFQRSQWFTRGWTLQELLAPRALIFVDQTWKKFGTAYDLENFIETATMYVLGCNPNDD
ncbi:vegetative incompatibility protein HET-E-1 [Trichoderma asperellum]|uniref:Vegetative incompatibility protein HET-E-1 n=1 Tax=Trichoderma asperellum TaxID=101201 RepID=A0A6V8R3Q0_TRIAP|nr:vegetative incompatibility protein HET-E-1 [Trichoderma asperellum]